jgi:hypothetical protein
MSVSGSHAGLPARDPAHAYRLPRGSSRSAAETVILTLMRDRDIRSALHRVLRSEHQGDEHTLIVDELGLCQGAARADVAVLNGAMAGFEIKSDHDTLARLPNQAQIYGKVFDYVTIIVGSKHARSIRESVPSFWGITIASEAEGLLDLTVRRKAKRNAAVDPYSVARLLWRDEALALLAAHDLDGGLRSKPRQQLWAALVAGLRTDDLLCAVRATMRARAAWRSDLPRSPNGGSSRSFSTS